MKSRFLKPIVSHTIYGGASLVQAVIILVFSIISDVGGGINSGMFAHGSAYGLLSFTFGLYLRGKQTKYPLITAALSAACFGSLIEGLQYFIPYRSCQIEDLIVNLCGAFLAVLPGWIVRAKGWL